MHRAGFRRSIIFLLVMIGAGCVEDFSPVLEFQLPNTIVVDSYLNATTRSVTASLSYAFEATQDTISNVESGATVTLESEEGASYPLTEISPGRYQATDLPIEMNANYRLHFFTKDNREFASAYVPVTKTPPIDSVTWAYHAPEANQHGINIMVNTNGLSDDGLRFLWNYEETWEYHADYFSEFKVVDHNAVARAHDERIYFCYRTDPSFKILLGNTEQLSQDVIRDYPLLWIGGASQKLAKKYSILVRQRAVTKEAYDYWSRLKATTEDLGGLFDPPLSQVTGNFRNVTSPTATVVGYFAAGEVSEKRIFIEFYDLPDIILAMKRYGLCLNNEARMFVSLQDVAKLTEDQIIVNAVYNLRTGVLLGYSVSTKRCADCRWQGGVVAQPSFW